MIVIFRTKPVPVETASIHRGNLQEIVEQEGKTRMHDHFVLAAQVAGKLRRIDLHAGDVVHEDDTVAWIDPAPIDPRQHAVLEARLHAAIAAQQQAEALAARSQAEYEQTEKDLARGQELYKQGVISKETKDRAETLEMAMSKQLRAAKSGAESAAFQVEEAKSALLVYQDRGDLPTPVLSPVGGRVLKLLEQSEKVVGTGTPILEIGYTPRLEAVADFLTRDAVKIRPLMAAMITDWGGESPIQARVRTVEPGAFTKISALGVEEQRVNVICDFVGDPQNLEDAYHVEVQVIIWDGKDVLRVPSSAVFRSGESWSAFVVRNGVARQIPLKIGHQGETYWEVLEGLQVGDDVVVHPNADVKDAVRVRRMK
jgi:HlyD family secretion protein